jgi:hypothetical protein
MKGNITNGIHFEERRRGGRERERERERARESIID